MEEKEIALEKGSRNRKYLYIGGSIFLLILIVLMILFLMGTFDFKKDYNEILVYFKSSNDTGCDSVFGLTRIISETATKEDRVFVTLQEFLKGPSLDELEGGYYTSLSPGIVINRVELEDSKLILDFNNQILENTDSCRQEGIFAQVRNTVLQFNFVDSVEIFVEGVSLDS